MKAVSDLSGAGEQDVQGQNTSQSTPNDFQDDGEDGSRGRSDNSSYRPDWMDDVGVQGGYNGGGGGGSGAADDYYQPVSNTNAPAEIGNDYYDNYGGESARNDFAQESCELDASAGEKHRLTCVDCRRQRHRTAHGSRPARCAARTPQRTTSHAFGRRRAPIS
jgi:hypothetical protein